MKRLTWYNGEHWIQVQNTKVGYKAICEKLAKYENTGLEPEEVQKMVNDKKILEVKTELGTLCAEIGGDTKNYPEIFVYFRREDGAELDLAAVGTESGSDKINAYLYEDTSRDEYTKIHSWTKKDIEISFD